MANELNLPLDPFLDTGLAILAKVYAKDGTQEGSTVACSEIAPAIYSGDFSLSGVSDGAYIVRFETNSPDQHYGSGVLYVRENQEVSLEQFLKKLEYISPKPKMEIG